MKKLLGLLSVFTLFGSVSLAANLTVNTSTTLQTNCNGGSRSESYYLGKTPTRYFYDILGGDTDKYYVVGFSSSYANIYNPFGALQFQNGGALAYKSEIKPRGLNEVIVAHQNEGAGTNIVNHASSRSDIAAQIVYSIARKVESNGTQSTNTTYKYMKTDKSTDSVTTNVAFDSSVKTDNECFNVYVGRCGDGVLDNGSSLVVNGKSTTAGQLAGGEQCDEGSLNGTPGHCRADCSNGSNPGTLTLTKTLLTNKAYLSGDIVEFRIDFKNNTSTVANFVILQDVLPNTLQFVSSEIYGVTNPKYGSKTEQGQFVIEYSGFSLQAGQAGYMIIRGKLKVNYEQCIVNPTNFAFLYANQNNTPLTAQARFECGQITTNGASCANIITNTTSTSKSVEVSCVGKGTTTSTPASINCGNGTTYQGITNEMGIFNKTCTYTSVADAQSAKISCGVANDTNNPACVRGTQCTIEGDAIVAIIDEENDDNNEVTYTCKTKNGEDRLLQIVCGNGDKSDAETDKKLSYTCKYDKSDYKDAGSDKMLSAKCLVDNTPLCSVDTIIDKGFFGVCGNGIREGYEQCDGGGKRGVGPNCDAGCVKPCIDKCEETVTQCLSIANSNVSVQSEEILPFWWRMYHAEALADNSVKCNWDNYNQFKGVLVKRDSMKCSFSLRQPGEKSPKTILENVDCDTQKILKQPLFSNFYPKYWGMAFGTFYTNLETLLGSSKFEDNVFGEYKIRLHEVDYNYCYCTDKNHCDWEDTSIKNVCETDFVITKPYLIQKSAFGTTPKVANAKLTNFFDIEGHPLINKTDISDVMILDGSSYEGGTKAKKLIINEASKIAKLAVTIAKDKLPDSLKNAGVTVKKVPNKLIYLLEGKNGQTVSLKPFAKFTTPFTIITKNINLVIEGSMDTNGMFVAQNGNISFKEDSDSAVRCTSPQVVKGIFVTDKLFTTSKIENSNLNAKWCMYGNLQVKGILIGNGIDDLVQNRRSNLNQWFRVSGSEKSQQVQRRNQIFNGASLLIEYNPDLWKLLPPGADQFVNLLDIYKK